MNILFIAYQAASDPLMESQGFSYMREIARKQGTQYSLLTFETRESLAVSREYIAEFGHNIRWKYLMYRNRPRLPATCLNIILGIISVFSISMKNKIHAVHARGLFPALISFIPVKLLGIKFFFDTRGLLAEKYVGGDLLSKNGLLYKMMRWGENILLEKCDFFTVETHRHSEVIKRSSTRLLNKMDVIPCCTDMNKFRYVQNKEKDGGNFKLVYLGKSETWYLISEMLDFFKVMRWDIPNALFVFLTQNEPGLFFEAAREKGINDSGISVIKPQRGAVSELLVEADAGIFFINPYKRYNSSPVKFGEYLACGLPVIVNSGIGDCDEIIINERVGVVIHEFSEEEYKRAIYELKNLLSEGEVLRERCRATALKYLSLQIGAEKYFKIYKHIMS
ncbi:MAG: glycosyltransferase [Nitrospirae bacterium]|nr:glycosyltransferase [Nitrospirota bacterium]